MFNTALPDVAFAPSFPIVCIIALCLVALGAFAIAWVFLHNAHAFQTVTRRPWWRMQLVGRIAIACFVTIIWIRMFASLLGLPPWLVTTDLPLMVAVFMALGVYLILAALAVTLLSYSSLLNFFPRKYIWMPACISASLAWAYLVLVSLP